MVARQPSHSGAAFSVGFRHQIQKAARKHRGLGLILVATLTPLFLFRGEHPAHHEAWIAVCIVNLHVH